MTSFRELGRSEEDLINAFRRWIAWRKCTVEKLEKLASKLHEHHINVSKSTIAGASASTVGGILAIAGLIMTPFTFGAGLAVSVVGAVIGATGGVVISVSKVIEITLAKLGLKEVQETIDKDTEACTRLQEKVDNREKIVSDLKRIESNGSAFLHNPAQREFTTSTEEKVDFSARFSKVLFCSASVGAGAFTAVGASTANLAGGIAGAVLLPLDIYMLVKPSLEEHKCSTTLAVEDIRKPLSELEFPEEEEIQEMIQKFIAEKFLETFNDEGSNEAQRGDGDDQREAETVAI